MYWICLSSEEMDALLHLVRRERENDFHGDDCDLDEFVAWQKCMQALDEKLLFVVEHEG